MRRGTDHTTTHIQRLWELAIDTPRSRRQNALTRAQRISREQLYRHGFSEDRRCTLLDHANLILLHDPDAPRKRLFANVIFNDLLHFELNCCDYGFNAILGVMDNAMKLQVDINARKLPVFRNPDGSGIRRFTHVSKITYLTTARRISLLFVWVHALGSGALMLPEPCRRPALTALSCMQTFVLAIKGRKAYSINEWTRLLVDTSFEYFASLEFLMKYQQDHDERESRTTFTPMTRYPYMYVHICMSIYVCPYMNVRICVSIYERPYMCIHI